MDEERVADQTGPFRLYRDQALPGGESTRKARRPSVVNIEGKKWSVCSVVAFTDVSEDLAGFGYVEALILANADVTEAYVDTGSPAYANFRSAWDAATEAYESPPECSDSIPLRPRGPRALFALLEQLRVHHYGVRADLGDRFRAIAHSGPSSTTADRRRQREQLEALQLALAKMRKGIGVHKPSGAPKACAWYTPAKEGETELRCESKRLVGSVHGLRGDLVQLRDDIAVTLQTLSTRSLETLMQRSDDLRTATLTFSAVTAIVAAVALFATLAAIPTDGNIRPLQRGAAIASVTVVVGAAYAFLLSRIAALPGRPRFERDAAIVSLVLGLGLFVAVIAGPEGETRRWLLLGSAVLFLLTAIAAATRWMDFEGEAAEEVDPQQAEPRGRGSWVRPLLASAFLAATALSVIGVARTAAGPSRPGPRATEITRIIAGGVMIAADPRSREWVGEFQSGNRALRLAVERVPGKRLERVSLAIGGELFEGLGILIARRRSVTLDVARLTGRSGAVIDSLEVRTTRRKRRARSAQGRLLANQRTERSTRGA